MYQLVSSDSIVMLCVILYILEENSIQIKCKQVAGNFESLPAHLINFGTTRRKSLTPSVPNHLSVWIGTQILRNL
jgi:hypothetical protein